LREANRRYYHGAQGQAGKLGGSIMQRFMDCLLAAALFVTAAVMAAGTAASAQKLPNVGSPIPLPIPSYWISDHGTQLKIYASDDKTVDGQIDQHYRAVLNSPHAPPGCQYQTFEAPGEFFFPQIAFAVEWKNWTQDCHGRTIWNGILVHHDTLWTGWSFMKEDAHGELHNTKFNGGEKFHLQP
jgi:hypothetical protein